MTAGSMTAPTTPARSASQFTAGDSNYYSSSHPLVRSLIGRVLQLRWKLVAMIGQGQFALIYSALDMKDNSYVAVKLVKPVDGAFTSTPSKNGDSTQEATSMMFRSEQAVLEALQGADCVPLHVGFAKSSRYGYFMVMELLAETLATLKRRQLADELISLSQAFQYNVYLCLGALRALQHVHSRGFVHRDCKPANFLIRHSQMHADRMLEVAHNKAAASLPAWSADASEYPSTVIVDFGLAKRLYDGGGQLKPARKRCDFRGSSVYASLTAHNEHELSQRDDVWSWLYLTAEILTANLPWNALKKNRVAIATIKEHLNTHPPLALPFALTNAFMQIISHLQLLEFGSVPDYELIVNHMQLLASTTVTDDALTWPSEFVRMCEQQQTPAAAIDIISPLPDPSPPAVASPAAVSPPAASPPAVESPRPAAAPTLPGVIVRPVVYLTSESPRPRLPPSRTLADRSPQRQNGQHADKDRYHHEAPVVTYKAARRNGQHDHSPPPPRTKHAATPIIIRTRIGHFRSRSKSPLRRRYSSGHEREPRLVDVRDVRDDRDSWRRGRYR